MHEHYKNAICFADKSMVQMQGDWFYEKHKIPFISIQLCKGKSTCKSKHEAIKFLKQQTFFIVTQDTDFSPDYFSDKNFEELDKDVFGFTKENYFPLETRPRSQFYGQLNPSMEDGLVPMKEIHLSLNEVSIDDDLFHGWSKRSKKFLHSEGFRNL